jgi:hypothetical protein
MSQCRSGADSPKIGALVRGAPEGGDPGYTHIQIARRKHLCEESALDGKLKEGSMQREVVVVGGVRTAIGKFEAA